MKSKNEKDTLTKKRNELILISVFFLLVFLLLIILFIYPSFQQIKKFSRDLALIKGNLISLENEVNNIEEFRKNYKEGKIDFKKIDLMFIDAKIPLDFIKFLENISSDFKTKPTISLLSLSGEQNWTTLNFQFSCQEDFSKILTFVEKLEEGPYLVEIKKINIKKTGKDKILKEYSPGEVEAVFLIKSFAQNQ